MVEALLQNQIPESTYTVDETKDESIVVNIRSLDGEKEFYFANSDPEFSVTIKPLTLSAVEVTLEKSGSSELGYTHDKKTFNVVDKEVDFNKFNSLKSSGDRVSFKAPLIEKS